MLQDLLLLVPQAHTENLFRFWEEALLQDSGDQNMTIHKHKPHSLKDALVVRFCVYSGACNATFTCTHCTRVMCVDASRQDRHADTPPPSPHALFGSPTRSK